MHTKNNSNKNTYIFSGSRLILDIRCDHVRRFPFESPNVPLGHRVLLFFDEANDAPHHRVGYEAVGCDRKHFARGALIHLQLLLLHVEHLVVGRRLVALLASHLCVLVVIVRLVVVAAMRMMMMRMMAVTLLIMMAIGVDLVTCLATMLVMLEC